MMKRVDTLSMPLPEDILKRKWAGDLDGAIRAIDIRLAGEMPQMLRWRLECERERIRRLPTQYPWGRAEALERLRALVPGVTEEKLEELELAGFVDFIYINGEKRYFVRFHKSLVKSGALKKPDDADSGYANEWLDSMISEMKRDGGIARRITLETSVCVDDEDFVPGVYLAHLPFPAETAQQSDVRLLAGDPDGINPADAPARCAWWRRELAENHEFRIRYSYVSRLRYADPLGMPAPDAPLYPGEKAPCDDDLGESGAYIRFTPYLRALAEEITAGETTSLGKAYQIYQFVTTKITYTFMRDYFQFDNHGEYCAVNLKGDCGL
ncbi:MAG: transglutaminase domain-containing protein [Clostridia bacterium]|nr:transglutaminase domain-containing protein [Clostridia bacterium]